MIYLVFNEGYEATEGELIRTDLCAEAIRLARLLHHLIPEEACYHAPPARCHSVPRAGP